MEAVHNNDTELRYYYDSEILCSLVFYENLQNKYDEF